MYEITRGLAELEMGLWSTTAPKASGLLRVPVGWLDGCQQPCLGPRPLLLRSASQARPLLWRFPFLKCRPRPCCFIPAACRCRARFAWLTSAAVVVAAMARKGSVRLLCREIGVCSRYLQTCSQDLQGAQGLSGRSWSTLLRGPAGLRGLRVTPSTAAAPVTVEGEDGLPLFPPHLCWIWLSE